MGVGLIVELGRIKSRRGDNCLVTVQLSVVLARNMAGREVAWDILSIESTVGELIEKCRAELTWRETIRDFSVQELGATRI
jgi:hypothetical protein